MTTTTVVANRLPWQDRWVRPCLDDLLSPLNPQHGKAFKFLVQGVQEYDHAESSLQWYGPGWNWTLQFDLVDADRNTSETLCYLVPRPDSPQVCIPLTAETLDRVPVRRLNKYVRSGVRGARRAVTLHWATWTLSASSEADQLLDLIKRKHKIAVEVHKLGDVKK